jgi:hypothetical protein
MLVYGSRRFWLLAVACFITILLIWPSAKLYRQRGGTSSFEKYLPFQQIPEDEPIIQDANLITSDEPASQSEVQEKPASHNVTKGDKVIVMAKIEKENTLWVDEHLPE